MNLSKDIDFFWTVLSDDEILSRVEEAIGQPWPVCGGVSVERQMKLVREGKIRLRAYQGSSNLVNIDCEEGWENFKLGKPLKQDALYPLEIVVVVPHINEIAEQFGLSFRENEKHRYTDIQFDASGNL